MIKIRFKRLDREYDQLPVRATDGAAGVDLFASYVEIHHNKKQVVCHSGVAAEIPEGYVGLLFPRSSIYKTQQRMCNCVGVIDSDYRGEIIARFDFYGNGPEEAYRVGDRFAQLVVVPVLQYEIEEVDELSPTSRGEGGFGSTGKGAINEQQESKQA